MKGIEACQDLDVLELRTEICANADKKKRNLHFRHDSSCEDVNIPTQILVPGTKAKMREADAHVHSAHSPGTSTREEGEEESRSEALSAIRELQRLEICDR
ncbi:hypothetical protein RB195_013626 [Necator americanus]|uniref:Uncharacterized protein n=1 Tax=Necator americanus TaxID=51031 RepID=A0ABR1DWJ3_NECAM